MLRFCATEVSMFEDERTMFEDERWWLLHSTATHKILRC